MECCQVKKTGKFPNHRQLNAARCDSCGAPERTKWEQVKSKMGDLLEDLRRCLGWMEHIEEIQDPSDTEVSEPSSEVPDFPNWRFITKSTPENEAMSTYNEDGEEDGGDRGDDHRISPEKTRRNTSQRHWRLQTACGVLRSTEEKMSNMVLG